MFGGLCFMLQGNMSFGVVGSELMVRVGPDSYAEALALPHALGNGLYGPFDARNGVRLRGWNLGR